jgi:hypothetical protein
LGKGILVGAIHRECLDYPGASSEDFWLLAPEPSQLEKFRIVPDSYRRSWLLNRPIPRGAARAQALWLLGVPDDLTRLQEVLLALPNLRTIQVPSPLAELLGKTLTLPPNLEVLELKGNQVARFNKAPVFPAIRRLIAQKARFHAEQFPSLFYLDLVIDAVTLKELEKFRALRTLNVRGFSSPDLVQRIPKECLSFLGLNRGQINAWDWLLELPKLASLQLVNLRGIIDMDKLSRMTSLRELTIGYCHIENPSAILKMSTLKSVHIFACKGIADRHALAAKLHARGVDAAVSGG